MSIDDHLGTVNTLLTSYKRQAEGKPGLAEWVNKLQGIADFLNEQKRLSAPIPKELGDISDLPEELIRELSVKRTDELEDQILTIMRACDGGHDVNLDQILVGLFRKFRVVQTRKFLQNKAYRMYKKGLVYPIPGKRAYSLEPQPAPSDDWRGGYDDTQESGLRIVKQPPRTHNADLDDEIPF